MTALTSGKLFLNLSLNLFSCIKHPFHAQLGQRRVVSLCSAISRQITKEVSKSFTIGHVLICYEM